MTKTHRIPRVALVTLGCAKNIADSDLLAGQLLASGLGLTGDPSKADAIVVNTCAFLAASQQESVEAILTLAEHKKLDPRRRLVVVGCLAQRHGPDLLREIPEIDWIVGPGEVHTLAPRLGALIDDGATVPDGASGNGRVHLGGMDSVEERWDIRVVSRHPHSAYVKISEGCDRTCSFCIIPKLRGLHRSRSRESIVKEVGRLAEAGVREVNLVAQELTAYGADLYGRAALGDLLRDLDGIAPLRWIRLHYAYPTTWSNELFACIRDLPRVCKYIDMPIQHVSEPILKRMRRPGFARTRKLLERFRREIPDVAVRTTLITGFPGETEADFDEMLDFIRDYRFDHLGVFAFSPEEGTPAAGLPGQIPAPIRRQRRDRILAVQQGLSLARNRDRVGGRLALMIDAPNPGGGWISRHQGQAPEVDGVTHLQGAGSTRLFPGAFVDGIITSAGPYDLEARLLVGEESP